MTENAQKALSLLRDPSHFQWYVIPLFALVIYVYSIEIRKRNWSAVFAGLAFWGMDWFNEIVNGMVFHATQHAPIWGAPGKTAYLILVGLNIEICFMFAIAGIAFTNMLPKDRRMKILGIPNRLFFAVANAAFCVFVEVLLNKANALTWDYPWWSAGAPWLIFLFGYLHFMLVSFAVFDMKKVRTKAITVGIIFGVDLLLLLIFGPILKWL